MKNYFVHVLCITTLLVPSLFGESKYERLLADVKAQNLSQLESDLQGGGYLAPKQYEQLIDGAKGIHETFQKKLSILSDPRDYLSVLIGLPVSILFGITCVYGADISRKSMGERCLLGEKITKSDKESFTLVNATYCGIISIFSWYAAMRGYNLTYARKSVDNAEAIVRAVEEARDTESETKASY